MSIFRTSHHSIDVTDDILAKLTPAIKVNERKDGEDVVTFEDVVTPTEHTYTTIERTQTGTKTVFDSSTETFGWTNIQYKSYEIINEPNTNNGRKMYVAHMTAQLADGTTHDIQYRLTFKPNFVNSYNLSGDKLWLQAKTNYVLTMYAELFDVTDNKSLQGDIELTMTDLDNAGGNFTGIWEGIALTDNSTFVKASYGQPKTISWHNQTWYSGNNNNRGTVGGDITIKVSLRDGFTHAFDYVLVNGEGYSGGFAAHDLNLANMTKVTTTSHEVPVYEDREVTHTETIDIHSTVEHITYAPIVKSITKYTQHIPTIWNRWDCDLCRYIPNDQIDYSRDGFLLEDNSVLYGNFVSNPCVSSLIERELKFHTDGQGFKMDDEIALADPYVFRGVYQPNTDHLDGGTHYVFTDLRVDIANARYDGRGNYAAPFTAVVNGVLTHMEFRYKFNYAALNEKNIEPSSGSGNLWMGFKNNVDVHFSMELFNKDTNKTMPGKLRLEVGDLDFKNNTTFEGVKPNGNTRYAGEKVHGTTHRVNGWYTGKLNTAGANPNAGTVIFEVDLKDQGYTDIFIYRNMGMTDYSFTLTVFDLHLDDLIHYENIITEDTMEFFFDQCCETCCSGYKPCVKDEKPIGELQYGERYFKYCNSNYYGGACGSELISITTPDAPCDAPCRDCWRTRVKDKFNFKGCKFEPLKYNYSYRCDYYNVKEFNELMLKYLSDHETEIRDFAIANYVNKVNAIHRVFAGKQGRSCNVTNFGHLSVAEINKLKGVH